MPRQIRKDRKAEFESLESRQLFDAQPFDAAASRPILGTFDEFHVFASGDVDADGDRDLVVSAGPRIYTLLSNGDGTFQKMPAFRIFGHADNLVLADFDGDGDADLVAQGPGQGTSEFLRVFKSDGDGTWTRTRTKKISANSIHAGNFDTDARAELLVAADSKVTIFQMNAGIPHKPKIVMQEVAKKKGGPTIDHVAVGDLTGDGVTDIVAMSSKNGKDHTMRAIAVTKNGTASLTLPELDKKAEFRSVVIGNFAGSPRADIVISGTKLMPKQGKLEAAAVYLTQLDDGTFAAPEAAVMVDTKAYKQFDVDILQVRNMDGSNANGNELVARISSLGKKKTDAPYSGLAVIGHMVDGANRMVLSAASAEIRPQYAAMAVRAGSADFIYAVKSETPGAVDKIRIASNLCDPSMFA